MIAPFLIRQRYKLIKIISGKHMAAGIEQAIDDVFVTRDKVVEGVLPNWARARPFLRHEYKTYLCSKAPECDLDCQECFEKEALRQSDIEYWKGYDIGFLTGSINGVVVIDIDPRNVPGFTSMDMFLRKIHYGYGDLPPTWTARTGRGGLHLYYKHRLPFKSDKGCTIEGVDFLGENSWCRLPPFATRHGPYWWEIPPCHETLASLPFWVSNIQSMKQNEENLQKNKRPLPYQNKNSDDRTRVEQALERMPISLAYDHNTFCIIGYALCSSGYADLFERWSQTDPNSSKWVTKKQLNLFSRAGAVKLASFFQIAKNYK